MDKHFRYAASLFDTVILKEFVVLQDISLEKATTILHGLERQEKVKRIASKAGSLGKIIR